jgi:hypothetical protein
VEAFVPLSKAQVRNDYLETHELQQGATTSVKLTRVAISERWCMCEPQRGMLSNEWLGLKRSLGRRTTAPRHHPMPFRTNTIIIDFYAIAMSGETLRRGYLHVLNAYATRVASNSS